MGKKLRFLLVTAAVALFATNAMAQDTQETTETKKSADGSYQFAPSWGIGLQYGMTFTNMANWNNYLLKPNKLYWFDSNFSASHELYVEWTPIEGFRISAFGGWESLYLKNSGFNHYYGGLEPAFSVRRSFYEFALGLGLGYGGYTIDNKEAGNAKGHGLTVRPFVEARFYVAEIMALYLRVGFNLFKSFGIDADGAKWDGSTKYMDYEVKKNKLLHAGPYVAAGFRFGCYPTPTLVVGDDDGDGVLNDIDECPNVVGSADLGGCPAKDSDGDGVCDPWIAENGMSETFADVCKGTDACPMDAEDLDQFEDEDGCPDPDNDKDGLSDPWVQEQGLADKYADVSKGSDACPNDAEDIDGYEDADGCPDPDNDKDGICDPWVDEKGLADKYKNICTGSDACADTTGSREFAGCLNPDADQDGYCEAWVFEKNLQKQFTNCKGVDQCPNEKGDDAKGCKMRRVEVTDHRIQINDRIYFALNKATIKKESDSLLEEIAQVLKDNPQITKVEIQGHTDLSGKAKNNMKLSNNRAKSVYSRLVKLGVAKDRLTYKGYGMEKPIIPLSPGEKKESEEAAATNRRVEFIILAREVTKKIEIVVQPATAPTTTTTTTTTTTKPTTITGTKTEAQVRSAASDADAKAKAAADKAKADADKAKASADKAKADADAKAKAAADKAKADANAVKAAADKAKADADAKAKAEADKAKAEAEARAKAAAAAAAAAQKAVTGK